MNKMKREERRKILESRAKKYNELKKDKIFFNALKEEMNQREAKKYDLKKIFLNMKINKHSQDIHFKKKHLLSLEKFSDIKILSELRMKIEKKRIIFELIEEKAEKSA